jgi:hypothetical protein
MAQQNQNKNIAFKFESIEVLDVNRLEAVKMINEGEGKVTPVFRVTSKANEVFEQFHEDFPMVHRQLAVTYQTSDTPANGLFTIVNIGTNEAGDVELLMVQFSNNWSPSGVYTLKRFMDLIDEGRGLPCPETGVNGETCPCGAFVGYRIMDGYRISYINGLISNITVATDEDREGLEAQQKTEDEYDKASDTEDDEESDEDNEPDEENDEENDNDDKDNEESDKDKDNEENDNEPDDDIDNQTHAWGRQLFDDRVYSETEALLKHA